MRSKIHERIAQYAQRMTEPERLAWQLERINDIWSGITQRVPAHRDLVASGKAPRQFDSLEQYVATVPALTKSDVQTRTPEFTDPSRPAEVTYTTGGSTGQPTSVPGWKCESAHLIPDRWMARSWYGITPMDNLFMVWGHSHLLGKGASAQIKGLVRRAKDRLLGYYRYSAYNLDNPRLRQAGDLILRLRPNYVIGYSGALDLLARANEHHAKRFAELNLKAVVASGEIFPAKDSADVISGVFGARVAMEYGSVETGVMAYTLPPAFGCPLGYFHNMWRSYFFDCGEPGPTGGRPVYVTALFPMKFPLVRFQIGDEVELVPGDAPLGLTRMARVIGRTLDAVNLPQGGTVHFDVFEQAATSIPGVRRFQLVVNGAVQKLVIVAPGVDQQAARQQISATLARIDPRLASTPIEFAERLSQTRAGKTPTLLRLSATTSAQAAPELTGNVA